MNFLVLALAVTGAILPHKMETVRAIFITIISLITLHSTLFAVLKLLIASNIIDEEKVRSTFNFSLKYIF